MNVKSNVSLISLLEISVCVRVCFCQSPPAKYKWANPTQIGVIWKPFLAVFFFPFLRLILISSSSSQGRSGPGDRDLCTLGRCGTQLILARKKSDAFCRIHLQNTHTPIEEQIDLKEKKKRTISLSQSLHTSLWNIWVCHI